MLARVNEIIYPRRWLVDHAFVQEAYGTDGLKMRGRARMVLQEMVEELLDVAGREFARMALVEANESPCPGYIGLFRPRTIVTRAQLGSHAFEQARLGRCRCLHSRTIGRKRRRVACK
jgi:hypothetical protein